MSTTTWQPPPRPSGRTLHGKYVRLEKVDYSKHRDGLRAALLGPSADPHQWDFLLEGPFASDDEFDEYVKTTAECKDPFAYAIVNQQTNAAEGMISYWAIESENASLQIGSLTFGACMQRSCKSSETVYLMLKEAFHLGYRRVGWCCHSGNERSRNAALRYGLTYEGTMRHQRVPKGRNRDGCFFSLTDDEWRRASKAFEQWLSDENQTELGQIHRLPDLICKELERVAVAKPNFPTLNWEPIPEWQGAQWPLGAIIRQLRPIDTFTYAVVPSQTNEVIALIRLLKLQPVHGRINIELIPMEFFAEDYPSNREAVYLLMKELFALGFRRVGMQIDAGDEVSKRTAQQLGFTYEATFRKAAVVDTVSRDVALFSVIDSEWEQLRAVYETST